MAMFPSGGGGYHDGLVRCLGALCLKMHRGEDAKRQSLLRFELFRKIKKILDLIKRNFLISPLEGEIKFLSELRELRNFREGFNLKRSCRNSNFDRRLYFLRNINYNSDMSHHDKNNKGRSALLCRKGKELSALVPQYLSNFSETVFSRFTSRFSLNRKLAFTLAEVLITLGIIGVVASLTLPSVINKYQEKVTVTKVKKAYSTMNNALFSAISENGEVDTWDYPYYNAGTENVPNTEVFASKILPYLRILKDCGISQRNCMLDVDYKLSDGSNWNGYTYNRYRLYYKVILNDGSYLVIRFEYPKCNGSGDGVVGDKCGWFLIDVNGDKKPNKFGQDVFLFIIRKNGLTPGKDCTTKNSAGECTGGAAHIILNGNMKY